MPDVVLFDALASSTRRQILEQLRTGPRSVNQITASVSVSQPAVSQHLRVLLEAQLVQVQPRGNRRFYTLNPRGVNSLRSYAETMWSEVLDAFEQAAEAEAKEAQDGRKQERGES